MNRLKLKRKRTWRAVIFGVALILVAVTFTPLILHPGKIAPKLLSLPFTLWTSMVISVILILFTYLAGRLGNDD
jgi:Na+/melibiose symporter-like transporter